MPTLRVALVWLVVPLGSPEMLAPRGITPPLSLPLGPVPKAGELVCRLNQSHITCAWAQFVKTVSETCGTCFNKGSLRELFPPGPAQAKGKRLFVKVTTELV